MEMSEKRHPNNVQTKSGGNRNSQKSQEGGNVMRGRKMSLVIAILALVSVWATLTVWAGDPDSPGAPGDTFWYTLEDIYDRLNDGTAGTQSTFTEPVVAPGTGTMHTLNEIMGKAPAVDNTNGATQTQVLTGTAYWSLRTSGGTWGLQTGSMTDREGDNASTAQGQAGGVNYFAAPEGYYDGGDRVSATDAQVVALDTDITAGNIKDGVSILGVSGTFTGCVGYETGVPKTGQTVCWDADGNSVDCSGTGQDGEHQKGGSWPDPRFTDNGDTITDNLTGLMWAENANLDGQKTWANALTYCNDLSLGGYSDWRLPNVLELLSLIDWEEYNPALPGGHPFSGVQSNYYWSSTTVAVSTTYAWYVNLNLGGVSSASKTSTYYVWPVRGGQ